MFQRLFVFLILSLSASLGFTQNLCQDFFKTYSSSMTSEVKVQMGQIKRIARVIRKQKKWNTPIETIEIPSTLLKETLDYTIQSLNEALLSAPATAELVDVIDPSPRLFSAGRKIIKVPKRADRVVITQLIQQLQTLREGESVNYLKYLNLTYFSVWAFTKSVVEKDYYIHFVKDTFTLRNGVIHWEIENHAVINRIKNIFKSDPYNVPIPIKDYFEIDAFLELWIYGVRPLGLNFKDVTHFDDFTGDALMYLLHDNTHFLSSAHRLFNPLNSNGKGRERILFYTLLKKIKADQLTPKQIYLVKYALHAHIHDASSTLTGLVARLQDQRSAELFKRVENEYPLDEGVTREEFKEGLKYIYGFLSTQK